MAIGLTITETISYEDSFKSQFKNSIASSDAIMSFVLTCSDLDKTKRELLNGNKFRNCPSATSILERLYANIKSDLLKNGEFEIDVTINGIPVKEMSPGMQAQALLKLLLNDELASDGYDYVSSTNPRTI
ncbi:hypothetical protein [Eggerthella sinensis]|uniref:hypothetical protein n=1 Tax=Eggerthella sinensis TaxID=242230 RepID=UPI0022E7E511|nr:hypothetical protein [Eggerthella sinensis]